MKWRMKTLTQTKENLESGCERKMSDSTRRTLWTVVNRGNWLKTWTTDVRIESE